MSAPDNSDAGPAFYIVAVSGGTCVEATARGIFAKDCNGSAEQQWTVQYGDAQDQVAFQNASSGEWLNATSGSASGKVGTSETKQWWAMSKSNEAGSIWLKCNDYADAYLCNSYGSYKNNNTVYVWPKQSNWSHALTWYLKEAQAPGYIPKAWNAESLGEDLKRKEKELAAKGEQITAVQKREADLNEKEQELAAKETTQQKLKDQLDAKEEELASTQRALRETSDESSKERQDWAKRQADLQQQFDDRRSRERDLASDEAVVAQRKAQVKERDADLTEREEDLNRRGKDLDRREAEAREDSSELAAEVERLHKELHDALTQLKRAQEAFSIANSRANNSAIDRKDMKKLKDENTRLRDTIAESSTTSSLRPNDSPTNDQDMTKLKDENARLRDLTIQQSLQLQEASKQQKRAPPKLGPSRSRNGSLSGSVASRTPTVHSAPPLSAPKVPTHAPAGISKTPRPLGFRTDTNAQKLPSGGNIANSGVKTTTKTQAPKLQQRPDGNRTASPSSLVTENQQQREDALKLKQKKQKALNDLSSAAKKGVASSSGALYTKAPSVRNFDDASDAVEFECGHVLFAPPRKIEKRVVGYLYE
ncbi:hypothetical protein AAFC00_006619 [Neodothiora populina]